MEAWQGLFRLTFLCFLLHVRGKGGLAPGERGAWVCLSICLLKKNKHSVPNHFLSGNG